MIYIASRVPSIEFSILRKPKLLPKIVFTGDTTIGTNQSGAQIYMDYYYRFRKMINNQKYVLWTLYHIRENTYAKCLNVKYGQNAL